MTIHEYYKDFKSKLTLNINASLTEGATHYEVLTKNRSFIEDYNEWLKVLDNRPEKCIYENAIKVYQESIANMLMGLYQPAFMGLRYFLERTLVGIYFSANELELRTWFTGDRDTYWTELIGLENEDNGDKDINVNKGVFSQKFTKAFFEPFSSVCKTFRKITKDVYRECSEYVHGNPKAIKELGSKIEFSGSLAEKWNDIADTIARCILYCFMMRYWNTLDSKQKSMLIDRLREEFSATDVIKNYL